MNSYTTTLFIQLSLNPSIQSTFPGFPQSVTSFLENLIIPRGKENSTERNMKLNWHGILFILLQFATCHLHSCFQRFVPADACGKHTSSSLPRIPLTTLLRLTRQGERGRGRERERNAKRIRIAAQGKLNLHLRIVYSFRANPEREREFWCLLQSLMWLTAPNRRRAKSSWSNWTCRQYARVCRKLFHMLCPYTEPSSLPVQTAGRDHPRLQLLLPLLLHQTCSAFFPFFFSFNCGRCNKKVVLYLYRYLPWLTTGPAHPDPRVQWTMKPKDKL